MCRRADGEVTINAPSTPKGSVGVGWLGVVCGSAESVGDVGVSAVTESFCLRSCQCSRQRLRTSGDVASGGGTEMLVTAVGADPGPSLGVRGRVYQYICLFESSVNH